MKVTYTADDGTTFDTEDECLKYEAEQRSFWRFKEAMKEMPHCPPDKATDIPAFNMAEFGYDISNAKYLLLKDLDDWGLEGIWWAREAIKELAALIAKAEAGG